MWIEELEVRGFRGLRGTWRFGPGLTLVLGDNEAGKSTLHDALIRALHGFSRAELRRSSGRAPLRERCAPWGGGEFGVRALLRDVAGGSLRVEWDFRGPSLRLLHADTGEDLTATVPFARGESGLGRHLIGLDLREFREACCLDQAAVGAVRRTEDLVLALQCAVESAAGDRGIEDAIDRLNGFLHDAGIHAAHLTDLPGGRLAGMRRELAEVERGLQRCGEARAQAVERAAELAEIEFSLAFVERTARELEQASRLAAHAELEAKLNRAKRVAERTAGPPPAPVGLPDEAAKAIPRLFEAIATSEERIAALSARVEREREALARLEAERDRLAAQVDALAASAPADRTAEARLRELRGRRQVVATRAAPAAEHDRAERSAPDADTVRRLRERVRELAALEAASAAPGWAGGRLLAAFALGAAAVAAAVAGAVLDIARGTTLAAAAVLAGAAAWIAVGARPVPARAPAARRLRAALGSLGAGSVAELEARAAAEEARLAGVRQEAERRAREQVEAEAALAQLDAETARLLDAAGAARLEPLDARLEAYLTACARSAERAELLARLERIRAELVERGLPGRELRERTTERDEVLRQLAATLARFGIETADTKAARRAWEELARAAEADAERVRETQAAASELRTLLGGETLAELEARTDQAKALLDDHIRRHGRLARAPGDRGDIEVQRERVDAELRGLEVAATRLRTQIGERDAEAGNPAELEERREDLASRILSIERARDAVAIAREALKEAAREAHRQFAPHLNSALERHLPALTGGRYSEAKVDHNLAVSVVAPETGRLVQATELSRGTQEQIYLLERLEIVRMLDPRPGCIPLLLDDPFAHTDEDRLRGALAVLAQVAGERQVILFTEDRGLAAEVRATCPSCAVLELAPPWRPVPADPEAASRASRPSGAPTQDLTAVRESAVQLSAWP